MRVLFLVLLSMLAFRSFGQKASKKASQFICECIELKQAQMPEVPFKNLKDTCMGTAMVVHSEGLYKQFKIKETTVESIMQLRDVLIADLKKTCPYFKDYKVN